MKLKISIFSILASTLFITPAIPLQVFSQSSWGSFEIGESGCTAYFPFAPEWELSLAVLYIYSTPENSPFQNKEFFFNSFRFPEY